MSPPKTAEKYSSATRMHATEAMGKPRPAAKGKVTVLGYRLFWESFGAPDRGTVLCLHGGPGVPHGYLTCLADLASFGYRIVFYDQLGVGASERPRGTSFFTIERGVEEVEGVRRALGLGRIHLLGNSYGGMLALAYAIKYQRNLRSLVVASGLPSVPVANVELRRLVRTLPIPVQRTIDRLERREAFDDPAYARAAMAFYRRHICRLRTWPRELTRSLREVSVPVYQTMWGPSEFAVQGSLRYWDITDQLPAIKVPTLITGGKYDEIPPRIARTIHRGIRGSKLAIFPNSSHLPMWEERERYMQVVGEFLRHHDGS